MPERIMKSFYQILMQINIRLETQFNLLKKKRLQEKKF